MSDTSLYQFVYVSKITAQGLFDRSTLEDIRDESRVFNPKHYITGVLCYSNFHFFQCVEGTKEDLTILKGRLEKDPRHSQMKTLDFSPIASRRFRFWVMQALVLESWHLNDDRFAEVMPFHSVLYAEQGWQMAITHLARLDAQTDGQKFNMITITQSELAKRIVKFIREHRVFFFVQMILAVLVLISLGFLIKEVL